MKPDDLYTICMLKKLHTTTCLFICRLIFCVKNTVDGEHSTLSYSLTSGLRSSGRSSKEVKNMWEGCPVAQSGDLAPLVGLIYIL